jgi:3-oxoacyl-[acyl-carrier-protein] synthase-3
MADTIKIEGGGYRMPSSEETIRERVVDEYGNIRTLEQGYMDGDDVFNFVASKVPKDIKKLCEATGEDLASMDFYLLHQANDFMNQFLVKKLKIDSAKVPSSIAKFGNTSSVSIPLTIVSELQEKLKGSNKLLLSAFGVGLSWGTALLQTNDCYVCPIVEI